MGSALSRVCDWLACGGQASPLGLEAVLGSIRSMGLGRGGSLKKMGGWGAAELTRTPTPSCVVSTLQPAKGQMQK